MSKILENVSIDPNSTFVRRIPFGNLYRTPEGDLITYYDEIPEVVAKKKQ